MAKEWVRSAAGRVSPKFSLDSVPHEARRGHWTRKKGPPQPPARRQARQACAELWAPLQQRREASARRGTACHFRGVQ